MFMLKIRMASNLKKAIIFDCDGVMTPARPVDEAFLEYINLKTKLHIPLSTWAVRYAGLLFADAQAKLKQEFPGMKLAPDFFDKAVKTYHDIYSNLEEAGKLDSVPGMVSTVRMLARQNYRIGIASNSSPERLKHKLEKGGLVKCFNGRLFSGAGQVKHAKPHPDIVRFAARKMGVDPRQCIFVDDSVAGVMAGVGAGCEVVGYRSEYSEFPEVANALLDAGADIVIDRPEELKEYLISHAAPVQAI